MNAKPYRCWWCGKPNQNPKQLLHILKCEHRKLCWSCNYWADFVHALVHDPDHHLIDEDGLAVGVGLGLGYDTTEQYNVIPASGNGCITGNVHRLGIAPAAIIELAGNAGSGSWERVS